MTDQLAAEAFQEYQISGWTNPGFDCPGPLQHDPGLPARLQAPQSMAAGRSR